MLASKMIGSALLAACAVVPQARAPALTQTGADALGFPSAKSGWSLASAGEGRNPSLLSLLDSLAAATGQTFSVTPDVRARLEANQLGLLGPLDVPAAQLGSFVESLLADRGFTLAVLHEESPRLIGVYSSEGTAHNFPPALVVPQEQLDTLAAHPAIYVRLVMDLPSVDVRTLSNSLRMVTDGQSGLIIPVGNSNSILIEGRGGMVYRMAAVLQAMDERAGRNPPSLPGPSEPPAPVKR
jgi:hypothetical protein